MSIQIGGKSTRFSTRLFTYIVLSLGAMAVVFPLVWMVLSSFKTQEQISAIPPVWIPDSFVLTHYGTLLSAVARIDRAYMNSLIVSITLTIVSVYTSAIVGYVLAKFNFRGRNLVFWFILATMMIPGPSLLVPWYQIVLKLGLINTLAGIMAPQLIWSTSVFMIRQFMHSIPNELLDAARIDGASEWGVYHKIVFPNTLPAISALVIFTFLATWSHLLWPLVVLSDEKLYTVPIVLASFAGQWWTDMGAILAGATVAVVPVLIVYLIFQRNITEGVTMTGLKG